MENAIFSDGGEIHFNADVFDNLEMNQKANALTVAVNFSDELLMKANSELKNVHLWERKAMARNIQNAYNVNLTTLSNIFGQCGNAANSNEMYREYKNAYNNYDEIVKMLGQMQRSYLDDVKDFAVFYGNEIKKTAVEIVRLSREAATKILATIRTCANQIGNLIQFVIGWCQEKLGKIGTGMAASAVAIGGLLKFAGESVFNAIKVLAIKIENLVKSIVDWCKDHPLTALAIVASVIGVSAGILYANVAMTAVTQFEKIINKVKAMSPAIENAVKSEHVVENIKKNAPAVVKITKACVCNYTNGFSQSQCLRQCRV